MTQPLAKDSLFDGLRALVESTFPKRCNACGRHFETPHQFLNETQQIREGISGLKQSYDDNDITIVEVYRNCPCGSTLMDFFTDRRDLSESGLKRRDLFGDILNQFVDAGMSPAVARDELLTLLRGEKSFLMEDYLNALKSNESAA